MPERPGRGPGELIGLLVVDKEPGWTSHDVVAKCRGLLGERRMGHAGTLDPDATGVLLVGVGRFTRMLRYLGDAPKSYEAEVVLGTSTSTLDASGEVTGTWDMSGVSLTQVREAAASLTGEILQVPPMVSALKVGGRRLHELARAGIEVERRARKVTIERLDIEQTGTPGVYEMRVDCSTGTYVRSLAADLGTALGGGAHLRNLRRTRVGSFGLAEAQVVGSTGLDQLLVPAQALRDLAQVELDDEMSRLVLNGLPLDKVAVGAVGVGPWALLDSSGRLLAVYERTGTDRIVAGCVLGARDH
ncbi:MAG TPA: tRNA pseudouridine(55) synthase TruB [Acidimicrobiales bacterium]|nr:tRNA pseudouridine(55) synthase TruB [Acidimicrobiales bacterium]